MIGKLLQGTLGVLALASIGPVTALAAETEAPASASATTAAVDPADASDPATHDPIEGLNRAIFEVNGVFYEITAPIVEATHPIRGLFQALGTALTAPVKIITNIATGDPEKQHLADIARENDVDCGFYVVLPFAGPTTSRDAVGTGVEMAANPGTYILPLGAGDAMDDRIQADVQIRQLEGSVDKYALARSATLQDRGCIVVSGDDAPSAFATDETPTEEASSAK
jgi:ABC-type transporter lipoprotein component MlaA